MRGMRLLHAAVLDTPGLEAGYGDVREYGTLTSVATSMLQPYNARKGQCPSAQTLGSLVVVSGNVSQV